MRRDGDPDRVGTVEVRGAAKEKLRLTSSKWLAAARCNLQNLLARLGLSATHATGCTACGSLGTMTQRWPAGCEDIKPPPANAHLAGTFLLFGRPKPGFGHWRPARQF